MTTKKRARRRRNRATTARQRRFMGAELGRRRRGEKTVTGMTEKELAKFARKNAPLIGARVTGIRYQGGQGKAKGSLWQHLFKEPLELRGAPGGGVLLVSKRGHRLWNWFDVEEGKRGIAKK